MRAIQLTRALTDPDKVAAQVVWRTGTRVDSSHRTFIVEKQGFVTDKELGGAKLLEVGSASRHELDGAIDFFSER